MSPYTPVGVFARALASLRDYPRNVIVAGARSQRSAGTLKSELIARVTVFVRTSIQLGVPEFRSAHINMIKQRAVVSVTILVCGFAILAGAKLVKQPAPQLLIGSAVPQSVSAFLSQADLSGQAAVLLSDTRVNECNERAWELSNCVTACRRKGLQTRMLQASKIGSSSLADAPDRGAPNHIVIADDAVLYDNPVVEAMPKPALLLLQDGVVTNVLVGGEFDKWLTEHR